MTTRNRWIAGALVAAVVLALVVWLVAAGGDGDDSSSTTTTTSSSTTTETTTTASTTTTAPTTTEATTVTTAPGPGPVTVLAVFSGGGSGEIEVMWGAVDDAVGYRILRADAPAGPFTQAAEIDVTTGAASADDDVTNIWSEQHRYVPSGDPFTGPDTSTELRYVEASGAPQRCFRVVALGPQPGPESATVCGSPP